MTQKVVVVDDDHDCTSALAEILRTESFAVRCADGGEQALAQIEQDLPDVVLTDIRMPGMDGYELLKRIREPGRRGTGPSSASPTRAKASPLSFCLASSSA